MEAPNVVFPCAWSGNKCSRHERYSHSWKWEALKVSYTGVITAEPSGARYGSLITWLRLLVYLVVKLMVIRKKSKN
ncbi:hypothetical protein BT63DRAFT_426329 [Microthyrium microscopicum]|uniref:Uncharacterized protein n=1 Tax=Microthyrium microscopicum TaxID=703497 RepID=A0A6A6U594_9PEZI|nr:hypothetical protein BT63DRAFT_426329 [Microthyrium microscopicum]